MPVLPRARWAFLVAAALLPTACGQTKPVRFSGSRVLLRLDEYRILPRKVSIRPGRIKIVATDTGVLAHNLRVESYTTDRAGSPTVIYGTTKTALPGQSVTLKVALAPGHYRLLCTLGNHSELGQVGMLIVQ
ncbi:MAG TPA: hypothetical protein VGY97_07265 [Solirubrobacteraceae bacterium]|jgi:hypothetical protein|nr:hypothetical protein [Solirubrobacteraceae bacterium]